jgi:hypothetical protein
VSEAEYAFDSGGTTRREFYKSVHK